MIMAWKLALGAAGIGTSIYLLTRKKNEEATTAPDYSAAAYVPPPPAPGPAAYVPPSVGPGSGDPYWFVQDPTESLHDNYVQPVYQSPYEGVTPPPAPGTLTDPMANVVWNPSPSPPEPAPTPWYVPVIPTPAPDEEDQDGGLSPDYEEGGLTDPLANVNW